MGEGRFQKENIIVLFHFTSCPLVIQNTKNILLRASAISKFFPIERFLGKGSFDKILRIIGYKSYNKVKSFPAPKHKDATVKGMTSEHSEQSNCLTLSHLYSRRDGKTGHFSVVDIALTACRY